MITFKPGTSLGGLLVVVKLIGCGAYGAVYSVKSNRSGNIYALKLSHGGEVAEKANKDEAEILKYLAKRDPGKTKPILRLRETDIMKGTACTYLLFPLMDISLFNFLVDVTGNMRFPKAHIQKIGKQLMEAINFLRDCNVVHCDIKSDNVLLKDSKAYDSKYYGKIRKVLYDPQVVLCDFGSAIIMTTEKQSPKPLNGDEPFLAPELCLGLPWGYGLDVYAVGLIMLEIRQGRDFIQAKTSAEITLALLHSYIGRLPDKLAVHASRNSSIRTVGKDKLFSFGGRKKSLDFESMNVSQSDLQSWHQEAKKAGEEMRNERDGQEFSNLMKKIITYDPKDRITAKDALKHKYFKLDIKLPPKMRR